MTSLYQNDKVSLAESCSCKNKTAEFKAAMTNTANHEHVVERFNDIIKSQNDDRSYRGLVLANKMKVLLISDPTTDKSAVALDINIGYMSDPDDLPGLVHFCEHMLFMGTEKYPKENDYNMYLSQNGGMSNASTHLDHTTYYFDITPEKLKGGLDRFAQFFLKPLFTETLTELELNAINSEHEKNLANDSWRLDQLDKSSASPDHPFSKFGTGNRETLDTIPKQAGINVRDKLLEFHEKNYSANIMSLCVLGKDTLDELEDMVVNLFCDVRNKEVETSMWPEHPFKDEQFRIKWYIVPIKDVRNLDITFPLPYMQQYYRASPAYYISHLLGHEGKGSLLSALKARGWCNSLAAGKRSGARGFSFFSVVVDLTEEGIEHVDDIITLTFQYIYMLKKEGPVERIYNEYKDIANMNFRFKEKSLPRNYVISMVLASQDFPMNEVLTAERIFTEWRPDLIDQILEYFTPQNIRVHVVAKAYKNIADETEKWYGTKYKKETIPAEIINKWSNVSENSDLQLPASNEFIADKFDIKSHEANVDKFPTIIEDTPFVRLWFKKDDEFLVPRAKMIFDFVSPFAYMDPLSCNLSNMFVHLLRDSLNEYSYAADLAGLRWELGNNKYGITLAIAGYDDKQRVLVEKIMDRMVNFNIDPKRFEILKENYIRSLKNFAAEQPYQHAVYYLAVLLAEQVWTKDELLEATAHLTVDKVQQFTLQLLSKVHVECLIHGNMTVSEAVDIVKLVESKLRAVPHIMPLLQRQLTLQREINLEDGCHFLFETENKLHKSSCTEVYYQTGLQATESNMHLELLAQIISEPCFNILRTKEQLGYIVLSDVRRSNGAQGMRIIVQSNKHPQYVEKRIDSFMDSMLDHITTMSENQFKKHKKALATLRLEKPKMLTSLSTIFWEEISTQQYNFDRANVEVAYLRTITRPQLLNFFKEIVHSKIRHKLSVHVISTATNGTEDELGLNNEAEEILDTAASEKIKKIDDIMSFKISQSLYPLLKPFNEFPRKGIRSSKL
ncbi:insulin-degrading enzyme isoform X2 [Ooceraea biroi]|uniref:Insulin-degrading enzyme n=1 Tax=Ooceraea biroi TaxID=2015173 RepID=A0A026WWG1_OOCBI|nr:insulin-degrading enzyme isoform X2 [Ooceraea biroi]EZA60071.1 Insulin-degrading enzyme [Ooceraea biroi]